MDATTVYLLALLAQTPAQYTSAPTPITSTTPLTFASWSVVPGVNYRVRSVMQVQSVAVTAGIVIGFTGPTAGTLNRINYTFSPLTAGNGWTQSQRLGTFTTSNLTSGVNYSVTTFGSLSFAAAGTLTFQAAAVSGSDTWALEDSAVFELLQPNMG